MKKCVNIIYSVSAVNDWSFRLFGVYLPGRTGKRNYSRGLKQEKLVTFYC